MPVPPEADATTISAPADATSLPTAKALTPPLIIVVTGPTCSGKTVLARSLSDRLGLPLFHKDGFKEAMFDIMLSTPDANGITREFSQLLGRFSLTCLEVALEQCARSGVNAVFEANFDRRLFSPRLSAIRRRYPIRVVQAHLRYVGMGQNAAEREANLLSRFAARERTDRHPGHGAWRRDADDSMDTLPDGFGRELLRLHDEDKPLETEPGDDLIEIDTANFDTVDYEPLFLLVEQRLHKQLCPETESSTIYGGNPGYGDNTGCQIMEATP